MAKRRILVVDDDGPILLLMRSLLTEFGFEPVLANSGKEALVTIREDAPDLVLLDRNMPGMSGDDVLRQLRASEDGASRVPVLLLTGEQLSTPELRELGADGAIQKPFDIAQLIEEIRTRLGARQVSH